MKTKKSQLESFTLVAALFSALSATADIKYWDNPAYKAYDVDAYVQDGLIVNYDGIRNAGPGADHDPNATTWVNCANPGTYDMVRYSLVNGAWAVGDATGTWTDSGFVFAKDAVFWESTDFSLPKALTHQLLVDATSADQNGIAYPVCGQAANLWYNGGSIGIRSSGTIANTMYFTPLDNAGGASANRPAISGTSFTYGTAILDGQEAVMFAGTTAPWSAASTGGTSGHYVNSAYTPTVRTISGGLCLGGHYRTDGASGSYTELFKGTLKLYRFYSKALADDEVAWNRVLDEYRYFGKVTGIPVTNAVVTANYPLVSGDTPNGAYAVDASGYTFSAPASKVVNGRTYTLAGHTVETFSGGAWTVSEDSDAAGAASVSVSASDTVRITWKWTKGGGLVRYDVDDYVQDGLILHYDGIRNVGADKPHDSSARQWQNIAPGYSQWPMDWVSYVPNSDGGYQWTRDDYSQGAWADDGFAFNGYGYFAKWNDTPAFSVPAQFTMQFALDGSFADLAWSTQYLFFPATGYTKGSVGLRTGNYNAAMGNANSLYMIDTTAFPSARPNFYPTDKKLTYANFMIDSETGHAFEGTAPTDAESANVAVSASPARSLNWFCVGGFHDKSTAAGTVLECFKGTVHDFRLYNRALTEAELAQNRKVDDWRYFGIVSTTNVLVQSTYSYLEGNEASGPYEVDGSYTFTAPANVTAENGISYACDGYTVETWNGTEWTGATAGTGASYAYTTAAGTVRLTWKWKAVHGLRTAADYSFDDLSPAGLALHYDGQYNAGVGVHNASATTWVNLGSAGAAYNAIGANTGTDADRGEWTADGYLFRDGGYRFVTPSSPMFHRSPTYTLQTLVDATSDDNLAGDGHFIVAGGYDTYAVQVYGAISREDEGFQANTFVFATQGAGYLGRLRKPVPDGKFTFATAILDGSTRTAALFDGVEPPTSGTVATGFRQFSTDLLGYDHRVFIASWNSTSDSNGRDRYLRGTVKSIRHYDRVLTEEELVRNRNVDAARYFGELGVTNVFVVAGGGTQAETGAYKVEGEWTFTATTVNGLRGADEPVTRYAIETLVDGVWTGKTWHDGASYTYTEGTSPATVRLTWKSQPLGTALMFR